jgi:AAA+ superfamily predicted ATPase
MWMEPDLLFETLLQPSDAMSYALAGKLREQFPKNYVLQTDSAWFRPFAFAKEGHCTIKDEHELSNEWSWQWDSETNSSGLQPCNTWLSIKWQKHEYQLLTLYTSEATRKHFLIAKNPEIAEKFFSAVCSWMAEVRAEILVFKDGEWQKSQQLFDAIKAASLDNLVLPGRMRETIANDFLKFFESKETYDRYRIAWKRGVLFLGPPGNGKTHMLKAVANMLGKPCLYVRSFKGTGLSTQEGIGRVFQRARDTAPCVLVLEDLDSLIDEHNRSVFLNEMDGFYTNEGLLTLATTNHPERLDPAILERPSRFDRKYTFSIPQMEERRRFIEMVNGTVEPDLQLNPDTVLRLAYATKGFSYAYLKELFLSAMMNFMAEETTGTLGGHMMSQLETLREQIKTAADSPNAKAIDGDDFSAVA